MAKTLKLFRIGDVGFIDWLGGSVWPRRHNRLRNAVVHEHENANEFAHGASFVTTGAHDVGVVRPFLRSLTDT